jgi:hypothetical protein
MWTVMGIFVVIGLCLGIFSKLANIIRIMEANAMDIVVMPER